MVSQSDQDELQLRKRDRDRSTSTQPGPSTPTRDRQRGDSRASVPSILVSPSSPEQSPAAQLSPLQTRSDLTSSQTADDSEEFIADSPTRNSNSPIIPIMDDLTISTRAEPPPSNTSSGFSFSSFLPSIPNINFGNLTNMVSKLPGTNAPSLSLVSSNRADDSASDGSSSADDDDGPRSSVEEPEKRLTTAKPSMSRVSVDLDINEASHDGRTFQDQPSKLPRSSTPNSPRPGFSQLTRTPSSAFVAAQQAGQVHPLTLHAVARQDSEAGALKVVRDRVERERELDSQSASGDVNGQGRSPVLKRKESWSLGLLSGNGNGSGHAGAEGLGSTSGTTTLPPPLPPKRYTTVDEADEGGPDAKVDTATVTAPKPLPGSDASRRVSVSSFGELGHGRPSGTNGQGENRDQSRDEPKVRKRSLFSRLTGGGNRARGNSTVSAKSASSAVSQGSGTSSIPNSPVNVRGRVDSMEPSGQPPQFERSATAATTATTATTGTNGKEKEKEKGSIKFAKVKTKNKAHKDFGNLFLAQELFIPHPLSDEVQSSAQGGKQQSQPEDAESDQSSDDESQHSHAAPTTPKTSQTPATVRGRKKNAVWAIKFSDDGRYLAVGGKDGVVRVWEVLSSKEARQQTMTPDPTFDPSVPSAANVELPSSPTDKTFARYPTTSSCHAPTTPGQNGSGAGDDKTSKSGKKKRQSRHRQRTPRIVMPVFNQKPLHEYHGHEADVLDLSWSKNNFLLSSSMDKTVRLWHVSKKECLCAFQHLDFVTSIAFHPKDDRFFLSGSLDCKLRLWNIPEKRVHIWTELPELITSVAFTRDGKLAIAGSFVGICIFFEVETFRYHAQIAAKSTRGKNSKGRKVTSMTSFPLPSSSGERLLITSNDSRMRMYALSDRNLEAKYSGHENTSSQIRASFSDDGQYIISGSEDRCVYIWDTGIAEKESENNWPSLKRKSNAENGYESFSLSANIVTCACFAPNGIRESLAQSGDPIFGDGHLQLVPLVATMSGSSLTRVDTNYGENRLVAVNTSQSVAFSGARDAIIVTADDETGVISIFRNSVTTKEEGSSRKSKRRSRAVSSEYAR